MPTAFRLAALAGLLLLPAAVRAQQFEGVVTSDVVPKGATKPFRLLQYYHGDHLRAEPKLADAKGAYAIVDEAKGQLVSVTPEKESYLVVELKSPATLPKLSATGKKETIAGKPCEHVQVADAERPGDVVDLCIAKGMGYSGYLGGRGTDGAGNLPDLRAIARAHAKTADPAWQALLKGGAFALATTRTVDGAVRFRSTAVRLEPKKLSPSLFEPPAGYRGTTMGDLNRMMRSTEKP